MKSATAGQGLVVRQQLATVPLAQPDSAVCAAQTTGGNTFGVLVVEQAADRHVLRNIAFAIVRRIAADVTAGAILLGRIGTDDVGERRQMCAIRPGPGQQQNQQQRQHAENRVTTNHGCTSAKAARTRLSNSLCWKLRSRSSA